MGNLYSKTVASLRLDHMEKGAAHRQRVREELEFLRVKIMQAETEEERIAHEQEIERVKQRGQREEQDEKVHISVR
jgi:hypothetical protein